MTSSAESTRYRFGRFELQPRERLLLASGRAVHLGPRAFDVLKVLVEQSGRLVTKEELFECVWPRVIVEQNTLQAHVSALRKALGPEAIVTVSGRGYRFTPAVTVEAAPAEPIAAPTHNLPFELTSFVGRHKELAELARSLQATRLLTLTGAGGCGKTRLALQFARQEAKTFPDGTWLIELAPLTDAALVPRTVAGVLGVKEKPGENLVDTIGAYLASRALLLVLDNAEHLLETCAHLAERVLRRAERVVVLVTSRERLSVTGELVYRIPSLSVPSERSAPTPDSIAEYESAQLFIDRARLQKPDFEVTAENVAAIAAICRRLDGIALALELAAPRVRTVSVNELSRRLDHRFEVLTDGSRTALPRHQTLRALIDWSHDLLSEAEKAMLRRVSVFAGGWTLEVAEDVCLGDVVETRDVLALLTSLADKNLILIEVDGEATRYGMLETVRQYARGKLCEHGEDLRTDRRHLACFLRLAEELHARKGTSHEWLDRLEGELDNLRTALAWASRPQGDAAGGLRLAAAMYWLWLVRGHLVEGWSWLRRLLAMVPEGTDDPVRAKGIQVASELARLQEDEAAANMLANEALALCTKLGDRSGTVAALQQLAFSERSRGDFDAARAHLERGLAIRRQMDDRAGTANVLWAFASLLFFEMDDSAGARASIEENIAIYRELGDWRLAYGLSLLGHIDLSERQYAPAKARLAEALQIQRRVGIHLSAASSLTLLGMAAIDEGDDASAKTALREALTILQRIDGPGGFLFDALDATGVVAYSIGRPREGARIWGAVKRLREDLRSPMSRPTRHWLGGRVAAARARSDAVAFDLAWKEGSAMPADEVVACALRVVTPEK